MMKMSLQTAKTETNVYHHTWFQYAVDLASKVAAATQRHGRYTEVISKLKTSQHTSSAMYLFRF